MREQTLPMKYASMNPNNSLAARYKLLLTALCYWKLWYECDTQIVVCYSNPDSENVVYHADPILRIMPAGCTNSSKART
jgi:hypothetical protein